MVARWFLDHPKSVGETYFQHQRTAFRFGAQLLVASLACFLHSLVPTLCTKTGSKMVGRVHARMSGRTVHTGGYEPSPLSARGWDDTPPTDHGRSEDARRAPGWLAPALPGALLMFVIAGLAQVNAPYTHLPAPVLALVLGGAAALILPLEWARSGAQIAARDLLRVGIVLLGANADMAVFQQIGSNELLAIVGAVIATLVLGYVLGRSLGLTSGVSLLVAAGVAICGATAMLAVMAVLPRQSVNRGQTVYLVGLVTLAGSVAMFLLPLIASSLAFDPHQTGIFLGGSLQELVHVAGAGYGVSDSVGSLAVAAKLVRVACLAPAVAVIVWLLADRAAELGKRPAILPWYLIGFAAMALATSLGAVPDIIVAGGRVMSQWLLLAALAALGTFFSVAEIRSAGIRPVLLVVTLSAGLAGLMTVVVISIV